MFKNLVKGSKLVILDMVDNGAVVTDGVVESVSGPHAKDAQPSQVLQAIAFGQQQEMVVDIVASTPQGQRTFRNIPATAAVDRGGSSIIAESNELMDSEVMNLEKISEEHIAKNPWHKKALESYKGIRKQLSPAYARDVERDETIDQLKRQYGELKASNEEVKAGMDEILKLLKKKA
ncbi:MAG: hypothetical protein IJV36_04785 [Prevotella sp.]|nr:hypothetical protein [Prevotella sp.]